MTDYKEISFSSQHNWINVYVRTITKEGALSRIRDFKKKYPKIHISYDINELSQYDVVTDRYNGKKYYLTSITFGIHELKHLIKF